MITVSELRKVYTTSAGTVTALDGISMSVADGEIHGIVGPSGAGKSTLLRCLTALEPPTSGTVNVAGQEITQLPEAKLREARRNIGIVFQAANLFDSRTALDNVAYPLRVSGSNKKDARARAAQLLELVGLGNRGASYPAQLSGGQRQRVGIARALATDPPVLLCDEPSSALDWASTRQVLELISQLRERLGITVLIITHEMAVVRQVCDSVTLLDSGRVAQQGKLTEVVAEYGTPLSRELIPLAMNPVGHQDAQLEVSFSSSDHSIMSALRVLTELGDKVRIQTGTIETLDGTRAGRFQLQVDHDRLEEVTQLLRARDLHVEVAK